MLHSDVRQDFLQVFLEPLDSVSPETVDARFAELTERARAALAEEGFGKADSVLDRELDLRYRSQQWTVRVRLAAEGGFDPAAARATFESEYDRLYGHIQPGGHLEITALRVVGHGLLSPEPPPPPPAATSRPQPLETRPVYMPEGEWRDAPVYRGADLAPGHELAGPLLVEEQTTTVFVGSRDRLSVDASNNYVIHLDNGEATA
jgi:N-methylhydantoinase A